MVTNVHSATASEMNGMSTATGGTTLAAAPDLANSPEVQMNASVLQFGRRRFDIEDVRTMRRMGVLDGSKKIELVDGEVHDMPGDGRLHRDWSDEIGRWLRRGLDDSCRIIPSSTLLLSPDDAPTPDWYVYPASIGTREVSGPDVLLLIEQSDTSLASDLGRKALLYARHGVRDYWVIDLRRQRITVHREASPNGYGFIKRHRTGEAIEALLLPGLILDIRAFRVG